MATGDSFFVACSACGQPVTIDAVSEFHNVGGFRGYSYTVRCKCGGVWHHDGNDGALIPAAMKRTAAHNHRAAIITKAIDLQRRDLPVSTAKNMLRAARLDVPELLDDETWLVYRFADGKTVSYSPVTGNYVLRSAAMIFSFSAVADLAAHLNRG